MPGSTPTVSAGGIAFSTTAPPAFYGESPYANDFVVLLSYGGGFGTPQYHESDYSGYSETDILHSHVAFKRFTGPGSELKCEVKGIGSSEPARVNGGGDAGVAAVLVAAGVAPPVFDLNFTVNPIEYAQSEFGFLWIWQANSSTDSEADQRLHQGLAVLDGSTTSYIDLNMADGPQSANVLLPQIGGRGSGTGDSEGWSFEAVFKPQAVADWAKLFCFGAGPNTNDIILGWYGNGEFGRLAYQQYSEGPELDPSAALHSAQQQQSVQPATDQLTLRRSACQ
jgi:hypothetical protein